MSVSVIHTALRSQLVAFWGCCSCCIIAAAAAAAPAVCVAGRAIQDLVLFHNEKGRTDAVSSVVIMGETWPPCSY